MHHSKLPLTAWFWAAYLMATHSNGISALQLQRQLAFGSYKTAWLICAKLRCCMLVPDRSMLAGLVEVDKTQIACRSKDDHVTGGGGRSHQGKMLVIGAVEIEDGGFGPGRVRLSQVPDYSAASLHAFLAANLGPGATAKTDGWPGYPGAADVTRDPHVTKIDQFVFLGILLFAPLLNTLPIFLRRVNESLARAVPEPERWKMETARTDGLPQPFARSLSGMAQYRFEFREGCSIGSRSGL